MEETAAVRQFLTDAPSWKLRACGLTLVHGGGKAINAAWRPRAFNRNGSVADVIPTMPHIVAMRWPATAFGSSMKFSVKGATRLGLCYLNTNPPEGGRADTAGETANRSIWACRRGDQASTAIAVDDVPHRKNPVLPSVALTSKVESSTVNADTAAAAVARDIQAENFVLFSDVPGIYLIAKIRRRCTTSTRRWN